MFYISLQDFAVMLSHHVFTVTLIVFSFLTNYFRIGSVIMLIHDASDFWLEVRSELMFLNYNLIEYRLFFSVCFIRLQRCSDMLENSGPVCSVSRHSSSYGL